MSSAMPDRRGAYAAKRRALRRRQNRRGRGAKRVPLRTLRRSTATGGLFPDLLEIAQIRRRLVFARRHQIAVPADEIIVLADDNVMIVLVAIVLVPRDLAVTTIAFVHRPGTREGVVDDRDHIVHDVVVGLIE